MPADPLLSDADVFRCSPSAVSHGDFLVLQKHSSAPQELTVQRPGATAPHFLVVGLPPAEMQPLMSPEELGARNEIRISVSELTGLEWRVGATQESVFTLAGTYRFILGPNLESEEIAYTCEVEFQPHGKRANNSFKPTPLRGAA